MHTHEHKDHDQLFAPECINCNDHKSYPLLTSNKNASGSSLFLQMLETPNLSTATRCNK